MENIKIESIKKDAIISIQLSGQFYKSLQAVLMYITSMKEAEDFKELITKINAQDPTATYDEWETNVETMLILCSEIEEKARTQNAVEMIEIPATELNNSKMQQSPEQTQ